MEGTYKQGASHMDSEIIAAVHRVLRERHENESDLEILMCGGFAGAGLSLLSTPVFAACYSNEPSLKEPTIALDSDTRRRLIVNLVKSVSYDFHKSSATHLFFCYYSSEMAVRSFHPLKDKAFEAYLLSSSKLACAGDDEKVTMWNRFIEGVCPEDEQVLPFRRTIPTSGVVNFKINPEFEDDILALADSMRTSMSKLVQMFVEEAHTELRARITLEGPDAVTNAIGGYVDATCGWNQKTVRISRGVHALLIALAHELSISSYALASFIVNTLGMGRRRPIRRFVTNCSP